MRRLDPDHLRHAIAIDVQMGLREAARLRVDPVELVTRRIMANFADPVRVVAPDPGRAGDWGMARGAWSDTDPDPCPTAVIPAPPIPA